jgi:hypothetical protein
MLRTTALCTGVWLAGWLAVGGLEGWKALLAMALLLLLLLLPLNLGLRAGAVVDAGSKAAPPSGSCCLLAHLPSLAMAALGLGACRRFGRRHRHESEYQARRDVFAASQAFVQGWSAKRQAHLAAAAGLSANSSAAADEGGPVPHEVALNHLADWTREEYLAVIKPDRWEGAGS